MSNARTGWNAAQLASERKTRKKVVHGPVGSDPLELPEAKAGLVDWKGCRGCGYHVCSCAQVPAAPEVKACGDLIEHDRAVAICEAGGVVEVAGGVDEGAENWLGAQVRYFEGRPQTNHYGGWVDVRMVNKNVRYRVVS